MLAKCVLVVTGAEAKEACRTEQLCGGQEAGIEGGIHMVWLLWQQHDQEEDCGVSSLIRAMHSMRITVKPCCGWCGMSGPVVRSLHSTATAIVPNW